MRNVLIALTVILILWILGILRARPAHADVQPAPYTKATNYMSCTGYCRWVGYLQTGQWLNRKYIEHNGGGR